MVSRLTKLGYVLFACMISIQALAMSPESFKDQKIEHHNSLELQDGHNLPDELPDYPGNCDPFPIPTSPIGPTIVRTVLDFDDRYELTVWRYPCDEEFSWIIFTVEPDGQSEPFICSQIILAQDTTIAEDYTLTQDPVIEDGSFCADVTDKRSFAVTAWSFAEDFVDLQQEFQIAWDLFGGDEQITMFAYDPSEYGIGGPPQLNNQVAVNGLFFNPRQSGHGIDINVISEGVVVYYYGHTSEGERLWLISEVATDPIEFDQPLILRMYEIIEGTFFSPVSGSSFWGSMTLIFENCDSGTAKFNGKDGSDTLTFVRLAGLEGERCQQLPADRDHSVE